MREAVSLVAVHTHTHTHTICLTNKIVRVRSKKIVI